MSICVSYVSNWQVVQQLVRRIPDGHQVKREVDFILNQISDTMTPMHYHIREVIFVTYNKVSSTYTCRPVPVVAAVLLVLLLLRHTSTDDTRSASNAQRSVCVNECKLCDAAAVC